MQTEQYPVFRARYSLCALPKTLIIKIPVACFMLKQPNSPAGFPFSGLG